MHLLKVLSALCNRHRMATVSFTDGGKANGDDHNPAEYTGVGVFRGERGAPVGRALHRYFTSYQAELVGILTALEELPQERLGEAHLVVTDSQSSARAITRFCTFPSRSLHTRHSLLILDAIHQQACRIHAHGGSIHFLCVAAHQGFLPNLYADTLATAFCFPSAHTTDTAFLAFDDMLQPSLAWCGMTSEGRVVHDPIFRYARGKGQQHAILKHEGSSRCSARVHGQEEAWLAKQLGQRRHMPSHLKHFLLMLRLDRLRVGCRAHIPSSEEDICPSCESDWDLLEHFIFGCPSTISAKLRWDLIRCLNQNDLPLLYPDVQSLIDQLHSNRQVPINQGVGPLVSIPALRVLLGFVRNTNKIDLKSSEKKLIVSQYKHVVRLIRRAWLHRCSAVHKQSHTV